MKQLIILFIALFALAACSKEETAQPGTDDAAMAEAEEAVETAADETAEETVEETLEVVEESAAVEEDTGDEPIVLARAEANEAPPEWRFEEGQHFRRLVPTQPTVGGAGKVEVASLFQYGCIHCYNLEPAINGWAAEADQGVRYVRIPVVFNRVGQLHAQMFYAAELLASNGTLAEPERFHEAVFVEFHRRNNRLLSKDAIARVFTRFGVPADEFEKAWNSFYVNQKINTAMDLTRRYGVASTPTVVVNGKYVVQNVPELLEIIDELLVREGLR